MMPGYWNAHSDLDWYCGSAHCGHEQPQDEAEDEIEDEAEEEDFFGKGDCTCRRTGLGGNDPDGGWRLDRWCPVHGEDPDTALERQRDDRRSQCGR
jgi:hypothetical protein